MGSKGTWLPALLRSVGDPTAVLFDVPQRNLPAMATKPQVIESRPKVWASSEKKTVAFDFAKDTPLILHRYHANAGPSPVVLEQLVVDDVSPAPRIASRRNLGGSECISQRRSPCQSRANEPQAVFHGYLDVCGGPQYTTSRAQGLRWPQSQAGNWPRAQSHPITAKQISSPQSPLMKSGRQDALFSPHEYSDMVYDVLQQEDLYTAPMNVLEQKVLDRMRIEAAWTNARNRAMQQEHMYPGRVLADAYGNQYTDDDLIESNNTSDGLDMEGFDDVDPREVLV